MSDDQELDSKSLRDAIRDGLDTALRTDDSTVILGQDVSHGGSFGTTKGLVDEYGESRVIDTPLDEIGSLGMAIGMATNGMRPIIDFQFSGFFYPAFNQLVTQAARYNAKTLGERNCPVTLRMAYGGGVGTPELHAESKEAFFAHQPGLKVVIPSNAYDAKGLLLAAVEDSDPVVFMEPKKLYNEDRMTIPDGEYTVDIGRAARVTEGDDVTVITYGPMVPTVQRVVEDSAYDVDLMDLRTVKPLDHELLCESYSKTGKCLIVTEAPRFGSIASEVTSLLHEQTELDEPGSIKRVTSPDSPHPMANLEDEYLPSEDRISTALSKLVEE